MSYLIHIEGHIPAGPQQEAEETELAHRIRDALAGAAIATGRFEGETIRASYTRNTLTVRPKEPAVYKRGAPEHPLT